MMNAISWNGIYVACPEYTFNDIQVRNPAHGRNNKCIEKYMDGGRLIGWVLFCTWEKWMVCTLGSKVFMTLRVLLRFCGISVTKHWYMSVVLVSLHRIHVLRSVCSRSKV